MKLSEILGLNARTALFSYETNPRFAKKIADSKLLTKKILKRGGIPVPEIYKKFKKAREVFEFDWERSPSAFALKPSRGLGGEGIIIVKKKLNTNGRINWMTTQKRIVTVEDLKLHTLDILEGAFSLDNEPDIAYIEEYVGRHKAFRKYSFRGTPDIRVVVYNKVPVMAMLRLPTKESGGRANLHQGAIAVGIDIATGITTHAHLHNTYIKFKPGTNKKLHGIKIPNWTKILEMAVNCQIAAGVGYLGADIILHPEKGPMVLEINSQPGLKIQLANKAGLRLRLERVKDLNVRDAEHGVKIAKVLFTERFADRVKAEEGIKILKGIEKVKIYTPNKKAVSVNARIDTGAIRSSIDRKLAEDLGLLAEDNILFKRGYAYRSAHGKQSRPVIGLTLRVAGRKIKTSASVANRKRLSTPLLIGRNELTGFFVNPGEERN